MEERAWRARDNRYRTLTMSCLRRIRSRLLSQTQRPHVGPYDLDVIEALLPCAPLAVRLPPERKFAVSRPEGVLLFVIHDDELNILHAESPRE